MCPGQELNLHGLPRYHLKVVRLPIPPPGRGLKDSIRAVKILSRDSCRSPLLPGGLFVGMDWRFAPAAKECHLADGDQEKGVGDGFEAVSINEL
jgi:hypothetical protein